MEANDITPGQMLKKLRLVAGLSIADLARSASVSESQISRVENGRVRPTRIWIARVTKAISGHLTDSANDMRIPA
ncbi:helix-turn-helix domain-containing protein [Prescottella agglutinans]|uniref:Transcriptional regulator with XRE-family HTH domain n=1 Tax=Prescottella agglutinans TaxID=1644129 RepID=A0ABT6M6G7_9NOCA|nr:helix-turn-helix transcriptional regulator [Prescottella agglutinans]MDH6279479.1 transcriptional regulator with XRE-family HTH domain [Prescottella agglutinans]